MKGNHTIYRATCAHGLFFFSFFARLAMAVMCPPHPSIHTPFLSDTRKKIQIPCAFFNLLTCASGTPSTLSAHAIVFQTSKSFLIGILSLEGKTDSANGRLSSI
jgi:hypothetical protein